MLSKREKRWSSKKRKIEAFLEVARLNDSEKGKRKSLKTSETETADVSNNCEGIAEPVSRDGQSAVKDAAAGTPTVAEIQKTSEDCGGEDKTQEELAALRKELRARQKASMEKPKLYLTPEQLYEGEHQSVTPILFALDIQHLLSYATQGNISSYKPRWCRLLRWSKVSQVMLVIVNDAGGKDFNQHSEAAPYLDAKFEMRMEMATPYQYGSTVEKELFRIPLSKHKIKYKEVNAENYKEATKFKKMYKNVIPLEPVIVDQTDASGGVDGVISPIDVMLSPQQMIQENYPLPIHGQYQSYKFTKDNYKKVSRRSPLFAIDCEMCLTTAGKHELTRVSIVNTKLEIVYDTLCKPYNTITNYLTRFSGITKKMLEDVTTRLEDVQQVIQEILPADAILVGQSLNGDLHALQMLHPYVIDTSVIYNLSGDRCKKTGLRRLTAEFLDRDIQNDPAGHNPCEDATVAMELVLLKLKKGLLFGDVILGGYQPNLKEWSQLEMVDTYESDQQLAQQETENKCNTTENTQINAAILIEKRKIFFERPDDTFENFFDVAKESNRLVVVIGSESNLASVTADIDKVKIESDKEAIKAVQNQEKDYFFNCLYLNQFSSCDCGDEEAVKHALSKVDKRIRKLMKDVKDSSLCVIIFAGRVLENSVQNGYCLVNVT